MTQSLLSRAGPFALAAAVVAGACSPTVKLQAPDEPIRFDVNVNITEEKRLQIDRELLEVIRGNPQLFGVDPADLPEAPDSGRNSQ